MITQNDPACGGLNDDRPPPPNILIPRILFEKKVFADVTKLDKMILGYLSGWALNPISALMREKQRDI